MELHERLRKAREDAGYETAADAARALDVPYATYANHENASKSGFKAPEGQKYARKFRVSFQWLMTGVGEARPPRGRILSRAGRAQADSLNVTAITLPMTIS